MKTLNYKHIHIYDQRRVGLVVFCVATSHGFAPQSGHTKDHHKNGTDCLRAWHACVRVGF